MESTRKFQLRRRALFLSWLTVAYNVAEGLVSIIAGALAGSIALVGFGIDSAVESLSGGIMVWRFSKHRQLSPEDEEKLERRAERFVAVTFFVFGAYVLYESIKKLVTAEVPEHSLIGIIVALVSLVSMPLLYRAKVRVGRELRSGSLLADAKETLACAFLSVALLVGLGLNYFRGIWQADPVAGLVIVAWLFKEGWEIFTGEEEDEKGDGDEEDREAAA
jgi:cation diffusion facilitator family transporter